MGRTVGAVFESEFAGANFKENVEFAVENMGGGAVQNLYFPSYLLNYMRG